MPVTYFFDDEVAGQVDQQVEDVVAWRDTEARNLAQRAMQLSPRDRETVTALLDQLAGYDENRRRGNRRRKPE